MWTFKRTRLAGKGAKRLPEGPGKEVSHILKLLGEKQTCSDGLWLHISRKQIFSCFQDGDRKGIHVNRKGNRPAALGQ